MFVERLNNEQLKGFFTRAENVQSHMAASTWGEKYLYATYDTENMTINNRLYDFEGSTTLPDYKWRKFLYAIFGEEYVVEYSKYLDKEKERKLAELK